MPLNQDNIIQSKFGNFNAASGSVVFDNATTADSYVVICAMNGYGGGSSRVLATPTNFSWVSDNFASNLAHTAPYVFTKKTAGGETTFSLAFVSGTAQVCWQAFEITGLDLTNPVHLASNINPFADTSGLTTSSTGTTNPATSYDVMALAVHPSWIAGTTPSTLDGHSNGFVELHEESRNDGTNSVSLSVSMRSSQALSDYECTASLSAAAYARSCVLVFTAEGAHWAPTVDVMTGFEFGTATGLTSGSIASNGSAPLDGSTGTPVISNTSPRTGNCCLELSSVAAAENVTWTNPGAIAPGNVGSDTRPITVMTFHCYFPTILPVADTELASVEVESLANGLTVWYRSASQKIGMKIGTGTEQLSDTTVSTNTWIAIHIRYNASTTTHTCDWQVDYNSLDATVAVDQTQATTAGMTAGDATTFRLGWTTAKTATVRYDDVVLSKIRNNYPIGDLNIRLLKVDSSGTPTTGGDTDWRVFTSNGGTLTAWSASGARGALDEVPPVIGASADGITQINVNGTNYANIPMETYQAAPTEILRAARVYIAGWAASGNPATVAVKLFDGVTDFGAVSLADHGFDDVSLVWICRMYRTAVTTNNFYLLTQARLDAMEVRVGGSNDANPDVGIHAVYAEVMTQPATVIRIIDAESGAFTVDLRLDTITSAVASYLATTPVGTRGATINFTISGVDSSHYVPPNSTYEKVIGASSIDEVTAVGLTPDPT